MTDPVAEFFSAVRPRLDDRIESHVGGVLSDIPLGHRSALHEVLRGGKRVRGLLVCLVSKTLGGEVERALPRAVAVELVQAASLIHDDVVDQDTRRRGLPAVWTLEGIRRAVLLGDVVFASAIRMMCRLSGRDGLLIADAIAKVSEGACNEPLEPAPLVRAVRSGSVPPGLYERIIDLKTGVLFGVACQLGAVAAGADEATVDRFDRFGRQLGQAYQLADDLMDLERLLSLGRVDPHELSPLVPALLRFVAGAASVVPDLLQEGRDGGPEGLALLRAAVAAMTPALGARLAAAVDAIDGTLPPGSAAELLRRVPTNVVGQLRASSDISVSTPKRSSPTRR